MCIDDITVDIRLGDIGPDNLKIFAFVILANMDQVGIYLEHMHSEYTVIVLISSIHVM